MTLDIPESLNEPLLDVDYHPDCVSDPEDLRIEDLNEAGWDCRSWTDSPSTVHSPHDHPYSHRVLCVSGWIEFSVDGETYRLEPGDALDLPEGVTHSAVTCPEESTEYWLLRALT